MQKKAQLIAALGFVFLGLAGNASHAQTDKASAQKPISVEQLDLLTTMASINMCILSRAKVKFDIASVANTDPIVTYIQARHGSMIEGVDDSKPLKLEQLINGITFQVVGKTGSQCQKDLAPDYKAAYDKFVNVIKSQQKKAQ